MKQKPKIKVRRETKKQKPCIGCGKKKFVSYPIHKRRCKKCCAEYYTRQALKARLSALKILGGKCVVCGEHNPMFLTIDHIDGGGSKERRTVSPGTTYRKIRDKIRTEEEFQVLCFNHNAEKTILESKYDFYGEVLKEIEW